MNHTDRRKFKHFLFTKVSSLLTDPFVTYPIFLCLFIAAAQTGTKNLLYIFLVNVLATYMIPQACFTNICGHQNDSIPFCTVNKSRNHYLTILDDIDKLSTSQFKIMIISCESRQIVSIPGCLFHHENRHKMCGRTNMQFNLLSYILLKLVLDLDCQTAQLPLDIFLGPLYCSCVISHR